MEDLWASLNLIETQRYNINIFNLFIKISKAEYSERFNNIMKHYRVITTFEELSRIINSFDQYKDIIKYIKSYSVIKTNKNYILFNPNLYKDLGMREVFPNEKYTNKDENLTVKVDKKNNNTNKVIDYLLDKDNFIVNFIRKRNSKSIVLTNLWKNDIVKGNVTKLENLNYKNKYDHILYKKTKKAYKIQKQRKLEFDLENEKLITSVRLSLPNSFTICLEDFTYIHINKIIISELLEIGDYRFNNITEKANFIFSLYNKFFGIDIQNYEILYNLSIKTLNIEKIFHINSIQQLPQAKINFTKKYIIIKYINSFIELKDIQVKLESYITLYKKYINNLNKCSKPSILLYLSNQEIDIFFD